MLWDNKTSQGWDTFIPRYGYYFFLKFGKQNFPCGNIVMMMGITLMIVNKIDKNQFHFFIKLSSKLRGKKIVSQARANNFFLPILGHFLVPTLGIFFQKLYIVPIENNVSKEY